MAGMLVVALNYIVGAQSSQFKLRTYIDSIVSLMISHLGKKLNWITFLPSSFTLILRLQQEQNIQKRKVTEGVPA